jgi:hypothetical protein
MPAIPCCLLAKVTSIEKFADWSVGWFGHLAWTDGPLCFVVFMGDTVRGHPD